MSAIESQISSLTVVYSTVYSSADQRKHQSSAPLAFVWGIHQWPVNSPHKGAVTQKKFHLMTSSWSHSTAGLCPSPTVVIFACKPIWTAIHYASNTRADSRLAPSHWETSLPSNAVSHWLGANLESALKYHHINPLRAKFFRGNINIYLHFVSFLHIDTTQVVEVLP